MTKLPKLLVLAAAVGLPTGAQGQIGASWCFVPGSSVCFTLTEYEATLTESPDGSSTVTGRFGLVFFGPGILASQTYRAALGLPIQTARGPRVNSSITSPQLHSGLGDTPLEFELVRTRTWDADNPFRPTALLGGPGDFGVALALPEASSVFTRECGTGDAAVAAAIGLDRCSAVASVPEPSTGLLLLTGVLVLGWVARRRRVVGLAAGLQGVGGSGRARPSAA